jgi:hypothetical protein
MTVLASTLYLIYTTPWLSQHCTRLDPSESGWKSGHLSVIGRVHGPFDQIVMTVLTQCGVHKKPFVLLICGKELTPPDVR